MNFWWPGTAPDVAADSLAHRTSNDSDGGGPITLSPLNPRTESICGRRAEAGDPYPSTGAGPAPGWRPEPQAQAVPRRPRPATHTVDSLSRSRSAIRACIRTWRAVGGTRARHGRRPAVCSHGLGRCVTDHESDDSGCRIRIRVRRGGRSRAVPVPRGPSLSRKPAGRAASSPALCDALGYGPSP